MRALVVCAAASALFLARTTPTRFPNTHSVQAVKADAHHDQRPQFDDNGPTCCAPNASYVLAPPADAQAHLTLATLLVSSFHSKGVHYNRPPPLL